jgi:hypothetical protein
VPGVARGPGRHPQHLLLGRRSCPRRSKKAERTDIKPTSGGCTSTSTPAPARTSSRSRSGRSSCSRTPRTCPPPTFIVFSGGGYQGFWKLKEPIPIDCDLAKAEDAKRYNLQIEILLGADNVHNIRPHHAAAGDDQPAGPELKLKKGRKPALARARRLAARHAYSIDQFMKAPEVQAAGGSGFGRRLPTPSSGSGQRQRPPAQLRRRAPGGRLRPGQGRHRPGLRPGRAEQVLGPERVALLRLLRDGPGGCDDDTIYSVITDPGFASPPASWTRAA